MGVRWLWWSVVEVKVSTTHPRIHFEKNLLSTFNVLGAMHGNKVSPIIFAGTSTVYGEPRVMPMPEDY